MSAIPICCCEFFFLGVSLMCVLLSLSVLSVVFIPLRGGVFGCVFNIMYLCFSFLERQSTSLLIKKEKKYIYPIFLIFRDYEFFFYFEKLICSV